MKKVFGIGYNDVEKSYGTVFYTQWYEMMRRSYSDRYKSLYPTYKEVSVCEEWHYLSNFMQWMKTQPYTGCVLDKDILSSNCKIYSPDTCCFVPEMLNLVILKAEKSRGLLPIGVTVDPRKSIGTKRFVSRVGNGVSKTNKHLGMFYTPLEAHFAWQLGKADRIEQEVNNWYGQESYRPDVADSLTKIAWQLRLDNINRVETIYK